MEEQENNKIDRIDGVKMLQQIAMLETIAKRSMSKESISRYGNLKVAHPETALTAVTAIAQAVQMGQLTKPLEDEEFKTLLLEIQKGKRNFRFRK